MRQGYVQERGRSRGRNEAGVKTGVKQEQEKGGGINRSRGESGARTGVNH